jgi:serine/threonine protein phosphatase 1
MGRLLAIGDIHGCRSALDALLAAVAPEKDDIVIPLGDMIDRGPDSHGVIERLIQLTHEVKLIPIRGNHEIMMLAARESPLALREWAGFGGDQTFQSYATDAISDIPVSHWDFIESTLAFYDSDNFFFVHAKAYADVWRSGDPDESAFRECFGYSQLPCSSSRGKTVVCGHIPQVNRLPSFTGRVISLDTGAHAGGWLTCLDLNSMEFWQANEMAETRNGILIKTLMD